MTTPPRRLAITVELDREIGTIDRRIFGHFIEHGGRCIYGGVFEPGSPLSDERGFRTDVLEAMRRLGVPVLRWPGGNFASCYHWEDGIGPRERRPARFNLAWRDFEPNTFGTEEFLAYCDALSTSRDRCEPYICVNTGSGTLDEAAHWVEYCNVDATRLPTHYALLRGRNGHPAPHGVRLWGIGNESYGSWQVGSSSAEAYAHKCRQYAYFMRAVDPSIQLIAVGADIPAWDEAVLRLAGDSFDYLSIHQYHGQEDYLATVGAAAFVEQRLRLLGEEIDQTLPGLRRKEPIYIAMDEWNANDLAWGVAETIPEVSAQEGEYLEVSEQQFALKDALFAAGVFHAMFRQCRHVRIANVAQMVNFLGVLRTRPDGLLRTPLYHVLDLYANHSGPVAVPTRVAAREGAVPSFTAEDRREPQPRYVGLRAPFVRFTLRGVPFVDAQATLAADRRTLFLAMINYHPDETFDVELDVGRRMATGVAQVVELNGQDTHTPNTFERPDVTRLQYRTVPAPVQHYRLPAHSATVLELPL